MILNDPLFAGEEFFFPPFRVDDTGAAVEFSEESFKKTAKEILKDGSAVINRSAISKVRKNWRPRRNKGIGR